MARRDKQLYGTLHADDRKHTQRHKHLMHAGVVHESAVEIAAYVFGDAVGSQAAVAASVANR